MIPKEVGWYWAQPVGTENYPASVQVVWAAKEPILNLTLYFSNGVMHS